ncbi:YfjI family protein [Sphingobium sp. SA2]|uniref:YfjI family protein n=1 Tax=Sphingobium sp. SA2 TaxID=1524832 RepID=UPI0028C31B66|nr:YfjI family protein [Sphingobium sp. SA2]MDT7535380.1 YfjI family protein [Sphingobium sp. SA2]
MADLHAAARLSDAKVVDIWPDPEPLPSALQPVAPFDGSLLPDAFQPWVMDIADRMQCPPDMVAVTVMVAAGSVIGRKVGIRPQERTEWTEWPNIWGCVIGRPGALKSPAMGEALKPLNRLQTEARTRFEVESEQWQAGDAERDMRADARKGEMKRRLKGNPNADLSDLATGELSGPTLRRYFVNDATYQSLGDLLIENPNGLLVHRDEMLSLVRALDREENCEARGFYLTGWNGADSYTFDRIGRGKNLHIPSLTLSLIGSTQPGKIRDYVVQAVTGGSGDDGLLQRFQMMVWPDMAGQWKEADRYPDREGRDRSYAAFRHLDMLTPGACGAEVDQFDSDKPFLRLAVDGLEVFRDWRTRLELRLRSGELHPALESHLSKYRKLVPAVALIDHLAAGNIGAIGGASVLRAIAWAEYLESHASRIYGAALNAASDNARRIMREVNRGALPLALTARDIMRRNWAGLSDKASVMAALEMLEDHHQVRRDDLPAGPKGGRPSVQWVVNPKAAKGVLSVLSVSR